MPYRRAACAVLTLVFSAAGSAIGASPAASHAPPGGSYLIDQFSHPVDAQRLANRWLLVYFGYSQCAEICPAALTRMTLALDRLGRDAERVQPLFVSLDPDNDSPAVLRAFAAHFTPRLLALTGSKADIDAAARRFGVQWHATAGDKAIDHGALVYLAAPDGRVVKVFYPQQPAAEMAAAIRRAMQLPQPSAPGPGS